MRLLLLSSRFAMEKAKSRKRHLLKVILLVNSSLWTWTWTVLLWSGGSLYLCIDSQKRPDQPLWGLTEEGQGRSVPGAMGMASRPPRSGWRVDGPRSLRFYMRFENSFLFLLKISKNSLILSKIAANCRPELATIFLKWLWDYWLM